MDEAEIMLWLGNFYCKSKITKDLFSELLTFISIISDKKGGPLSSFYKFEKYLNTLAPLETISTYVFCSTCREPVIKENWKNCTTCSIERSANQLVKDGTYFVSCSIEKAIRNILEVKENEKSIVIYREKMMEESSCIRDVTDTQSYKKIISRCDLNNMYNSTIPLLTLSINIDGVEQSKSSKRSLYPLQLVINEFPPHLRPRNIIIPFIFMKGENVDFDDKLLAPFIAELNNLWTNGLTWVSGLSNQQYKTQVCAFCYSMDAIMKPKLLGIVYPTAYCSCSKCCVVGEWFAKGKGGSVVYLAEGDGAQLRRSNLDFSLNTRGQVSYPAIMDIIGNGDIFKMAVIDSMHNVYLGNVKYLTKRIFSNSAKGKSLQTAADEIITGIHAPNFIERGPRPFSDVPHWKAHEWANYLFYYSIPIYDELVERALIPEMERDHWFTLINGIYLLNSRAISQHDIKVSQAALKTYHSNMPTVHNKGFCTYNVHASTHLPECVQDLGPLWATSMFMFEGFNSTIIKSCNGTQHIPLQIAERLSWRRPLMLLHQIVEEVQPGSISVTQSLFRNIQNEGILKLQKKSQTLVNECERSMIAEHFGSGCRNLVAYDGILYKGLKLSTWLHDHRCNTVRKQNCYIFSNTHQIYGQIKRLIVEDGTRLFAIFNRIEGDATLFNYCIKNCKSKSDLAIDCVIDSSFTKCIKIPSRQGIYIMKKINDCKGS